MDISIFPRRSISLVQPNGCLLAPFRQLCPSDLQQIKTHTLLTGGLLQLATRLEISAILIEKSPAFFFISFRCPLKKIKQNRTLTGPVPACPTVCSPETQEGPCTAPSEQPLPSEPRALCTVKCQGRLIYKTDLPSGECNYAHS